MPSIAISHVVVCVCFCIFAVIESSSSLCDGRLTRPKMAAMISRTYPACRDVDLTHELAICEAGEADVSDTFTEILPPLKSKCPDGSWNRTCYPVPPRDVIYAFSCVCSSALQNWNVDVRATYWSDLESLSTPVNGASYTRRLMLEGGECIAREFMKMVTVVVSYNLPNSVYTASSFDIWSFEPYRARLDNYLAI